MKKFTFTFFVLIFTTMAYGTTWTVVNSGFTFSPSVLTITEGDTVIFDLASEHNSTEVSQSTWNANGTTPLPGGWQTPFGGGMVLPSDLTEGTHWYVCQPHASMGMKGMIIVQGTTSTADHPAFASVNVFPNPSDGHIRLSGNVTTDEIGVEIYDVQGIKVYATTTLEQKPLHEIQIPKLEEGLYILRLRSQDGMATRKVIVNR